MLVMKFFKKIFEEFFLFEEKIEDSFLGLSHTEMHGILRHARASNVRFLEQLVAMRHLSAVEIGFLLSEIELDDEKIETIQKATEIYKEEDFVQHGQTFTDFIFRVCVNIDMLNCSNIEMFKELTNCKNEIYDFANAIKNPLKFRQRRKNKPAYAFEKIIY